MSKQEGMERSEWRINKERARKGKGEGMYERRKEPDDVGSKKIGMYSKIIPMLVDHAREKHGLPKK